jgi:hypothetical protein
MEESDKVFKFYINRRRPKPYYQTHLLAEQCRYLKPDGEHCNRMVVTSIPFCPQHLAIELNLKVKKSTIPHAGKGLFAYDPNKGANAIVFRANQLICPYDGEIINNAELRRRYRQFTAPYGIQIANNRYEDAARIRGVGCYVNHSDNENLINCRLAVSNNRIVIKATKIIKNNKELFADYGEDYRFDEKTHYSTR